MALRSLRLCGAYRPCISVCLRGHSIVYMKDIPWVERESCLDLYQRALPHGVCSIAPYKTPPGGI